MNEGEIARWQKEVLAPSLRGEVPTSSGDLPGGGLALLSADTDHTQRFVFESARLTAIRGASMRLDQLNRDGLPAVLDTKKLPIEYIDASPPGCLIYCGGGSLMALVPAAMAETLVREIESLYPRETGVATITAVALPITPAEVRGQAAAFDPDLLETWRRKLSPLEWTRFVRNLGGDDKQPLDEALAQKGVGLSHLMRRQALALRQRKGAKEVAPFFETLPFARLCRLCGRRAATSEDELHNQICQVCYKNGRMGSWSGEKGYWYQEFEKRTRIRAEMPKDLEAIARDSTKEGFVGYIYADGNGIGRFLEEAETLLDYRHRSNHLAEAIESSVYTALAQHLSEDSRAKAFEIITIGGDDALLIVPAHATVEVALEICQGFGQKLAENYGELAPVMSAGVVLAHESNPIYFLHDLARQLLKSAKRRAWELQQEDGNGRKHPCLDFMILKSQSTVATTLNDVRNSPWLKVESQQDRERCRLTGRPYTLPEIKTLLAGARRLGEINFAPGQLHGMRPAFLHGRQPGLLYYLYQRARLGTDGRDSLAAIEAEWGMNEKTEPLCWRSRGRANDGFKEYDTPLLDMLELLDFVKGKEDENTD